jgi:outer membrane protein TolC
VYETRKVDCQIRTLELKLNSDRETARLKIAELSRKIDETKKAFAVAREDVAIATKALDIARKKYDAQLITNLELLNTRNQLTSKMMAYTQARIAAILAIEEFKAEALSSSNAPSAQ